MNNYVLSLWLSRFFLKNYEEDDNDYDDHDNDADFDAY